MKTKDKILTKALELFNEKGVLNVSLRHIASALFISQGNLNYHYKHREDLVSALYEQMVTAIQTQALEGSNEIPLLIQFMEENRHEMNILYQYRFLVIDFNQNMKMYPSILQKHQENEQFQREKFTTFVRKAIDENILRGPAFENEYKDLFERIAVFKTYWLSAITIQRKADESDVQRYINLLNEMVFPYLSKDSQREFLLKRM
jgi:AcrR family transcriptional regulator